MRVRRTQSPAAVQLSILTQFFPPDYAATGQLIEELASHLTQQGVKVQVFTGQPGYAYQRQWAPAQEVSRGITIRRTRTSQFWPKRIRGRAIGGLLYCLRALVKLLNPALRGDLLLVTTEPPYLPVIAYLLHLLFRQRYICLVYDLYPSVAVELNVVPEQHWVVKSWDWLNRRIWQSAESIITLSPTMRQRIVQQCPEASDRISVVHNWADPKLIRPLAKEENWFARQHGLDQVFTVLYSGNMGRCHDMVTILAAAQLLRDQAIRFVFIGAGAKLADCEQVVAAEGLKNCLFLPYQSKETLPYSLTACDLSLVSLSPGMEGLVCPSKLYGSLAAGRPIAAICESHSYLRGILREAACGQAFSSGDGVGLANFIQALAVDTERAEQMGQRGRVYLEEHFTPERIARQYLALVENCVASAADAIAVPVYVEPKQVSLGKKLNIP